MSDETQPIAPSEFLRQMKMLAAHDDTEHAHRAADALLCETLHSLGYGDGVAVFVEMDRWYA